MIANNENIKLKIQKRILFFGILILGAKFGAFFITNSVGILTDAFESIVNVTAGAITLYSLHLASKPRDLDHPYGHGKVEMLSASIEGILIILAGGIMIVEAIKRIFTPVPVDKLDIGILLVTLGGLANYLLGYYSIRVGKNKNSIALIAGGKHLQSDTYSTIGLLIGLGLLFLFPKQLWIDSAIAIVFGLIIIITGGKILKETISTLMDKADFSVITDISKILWDNRQEKWIDIHNLRLVKYGEIMHLDCDLTLPWYLSIKEAHTENDILKKAISDNYADIIDLTVHFDACKPAHCKHCQYAPCTHRTEPFTTEKAWSLEYVTDSKALGETRLID